MTTPPASSAALPDPPPRSPQQPALEDCCLSGCSPCIFELYEDALERYRIALAQWQARHPEVPPHPLQEVPPDEFPHG